MNTKLSELNSVSTLYGHWVKWT